MVDFNQPGTRNASPGIPAQKFHYHINRAMKLQYTSFHSLERTFDDLNKIAKGK